MKRKIIEDGKPPRDRRPWGFLVLALVIAGAASAIWWGSRAAKRPARQATQIAFPTLEQAIAEPAALEAVCRAIDQPLPPPLASMAPEAAQAIHGALGQTAEVREQGSVAGEAYGRLGQVYHAHEMYEQADAAYRSALEADPQSFKWTYYAALAANQSGKPQVAIDGLRNALKLDPGYAAAYLRLGRICLEQGHLDEARQAFETCVKLRPSDPNGHVGLGQVAYARSDLQAVVKHMEEALELAPADYRVHHQLGLAYRALGDAKRADLHTRLARSAPKVEVTYDPLMEETGRLNDTSRANRERRSQFLARGTPAKALPFALRVTQQQPQDADGWCGLATVYRELGRYPQAEAAALRALELDPRGAAARSELAMIYIGLGELSRAAENVEQAIVLDPSAAASWSTRAYILKQLGRPAEALQAMNKAVELDPDQADYHKNLGILLAEQGETAGAVAAFEHHLELQPNSPDVRAQLERLRAMMR